MPELQCERLHFPSADGQHTIAAVVYTMPNVPVRAVLQLSHGMCEYVRRYEPMARWYAAHGIALAGNDHLGHGDTAAPDERGCYGAGRGRYNLLDDLHTMNRKLHEKFPHLPLALYGHSMGSFYARWYAEKWPETIDLLILSGTAGPSISNRMGHGMAATIAKFRGDRYVSPFMVKMNFGSFNKRIPDAVSPNAWLTRDDKVVQAYDADPLCAFSFSAATYREMLATINHVSSKKWANAMPKDLPVLLIAGEGDPVGGYGTGVKEVYSMLGNAGVRDITCQLYAEARHELHNELNKEDVFNYVQAWIDDRI